MKLSLPQEQYSRTKAATTGPSPATAAPSKAPASGSSSSGPYSGQFGGKPASAKAANSLGTWRCDTCTYAENDLVDSAACEMCGSKRPPAPRA